MPDVTRSTYAVVVTEEDTVSTDEATPRSEDVDAGSGHPEIVRGGQRVIVVNSQPRPGEGDLPPRQVRGLGSVSLHATDPVTKDQRPRKSGAGSALLAIVTAAVPVLLAAFAIRIAAERFDASRTVVLGATAVLAVCWLIGLASAWRGLGPKGRDGRGSVFFGRAVGLVAGAVGAVYLLIEVVPPLL